MNKETVLKVLLSIPDEQKADLAFKFFHDWWSMDNPDWYLNDTLMRLYDIIMEFDPERHSNNKLMHYLLSSSVFT